MTTLVSFLGKNIGDPKTGYREATYRFPDGREIQTPFFGLAMTEVIAPDRVVILGTAGSMWEVLIEHLAAETEAEEIRLALMDAAQRATVDAAMLEQVRPLVERRLGRPAELRLIPYGRDDDEQRGILRAIADAIPTGRAVLDLTHGFRHLAALGLLSAFFLERMAKLDVAGLYYGALDMTQNGITPVVRLDGLIAIQRWIDALDRFDQSGDYGVFAPLLTADDVPRDKARCLEDAAFHERTFNIKDARRKLQTFLPVLDAPLTGASGLFQKKLAERLSWIKETSLDEHQRKLAYIYLNRRDYVRAAVFAWEGIITRECAGNGLDPQDFGEEGDRAQGEKALRERLKQEGEVWSDSPHRRIKELRNSLAHGSPPWTQMLRNALSDPAKLHKQLEADLRRALG